MFPADRFAPFREFDWSTTYEMFRDFYKSSASPYEFNFAFMSKHALSRIYERFVALLEFEDDVSGQLSFLPSIPLEKQPRKAGAVYTPQFIASFFVRYVRENVTPRMFRNVRFIDPACGSGIFARTLLVH
jgi:type I restriction-modification system DNA methylase subunit